MEYEEPVSWNVDVRCSNNTIQVITVKALSPKEASSEALKIFTRDLNVKIKRAYN